ncbi:NAD+ synthase [bacterium]|nr:NAD+ synthase [bacterium]
MNNLNDDNNSLALNLPLARNILAEFIRAEITRTGLSKAIVGLSGGIDSALVVHLCVEALGKNNVLAVMMPHSSSSKESVVDAERVIQDTGCRAKKIDISPIADPYVETYIEDNSTRRGNVFARLRMIILYDLSAEENSLVVGTSNKTEILLGYSTLHGDTAWALGPIGDLYKTQVRDLSEYMGVATEIISKPPSADLIVGQTDESDLGITYADADRILYQIVDARIRPEVLIQQGEDEEKVNLIMNRVKKFQFKRVPAPIAKISSRTFGEDWLYARDWMT